MYSGKIALPPGGGGKQTVVSVTINTTRGEKLNLVISLVSTRGERVQFSPQLKTE
jgi:hypothetical protein